MKKADNMDLDDDLMDIFEDNSNEKPEKQNFENWVFPIIGRISSVDKIYSNGTGFFINNEGFFVTAGHVIENQTLAYKVFLNDKV